MGINKVVALASRGCAVLLFAIGGSHEFAQIANAQIETQESDRWTDLHGQFVVKGDVPKFSLDESLPTICESTGSKPLDDDLRIGPHGQLADVFVILTSARDAEVPIHESYQIANDKQIEVIVRDCRFHPHSFCLRPGQELILRNDDSIGHLCQLFTFNNSENVKLSRHDQVSLRFPRSDRLPGRWICGAHHWMNANMLVHDNPYVAITDAGGQFAMVNVPIGNWEFVFWHKKFGYLLGIEPSLPQSSKKGHFKIDLLDCNRVDLGRIVVSAETMLPLRASIPLPESPLPVGTN
jgi:hypothetical protein